MFERAVWLHPEQGAEPLAGGSAYFAAFAEFEHALAFSSANVGAEQPPLRTSGSDPAIRVRAPREILLGEIAAEESVYRMK